MPDPRKPRSEAELPEPFRVIGEDGWVERAHAVLRTYGVPLPTTASPDEIACAEERLGARLPPAYRLLLLELGPLDFDGIAFLPVSEVAWLDDFWARASFAPEDSVRLRRTLAIVDYCGSGDVIALDPATGECALCGHDPPGFSDRLPSIDALVQYSFMSLPTSYYGWNERDLHDLVDATLRQRFGVLL